MAGSGRRLTQWFAAVLAVAGALALSGFTSARSPAVASGGWSKAVTVPGVGKAGTTGISIVSCSSPGNCGAIGSAGGALFSISQVRGTWGKPVTIRGLARTSKPSAGVGGLVCRAGGCVMVGSYTDAGGHSQAFIASEAHGTWGKPFWVPGLARLNRGNSASLGNLTCRSAGNCSAAGSYLDGSGNGRTFLLFEVNGTWGHAAAVPVFSPLPGETAGTSPSFGPVSCATPGNCGAAGSYPVNGGNQEYVDNEVNGVWGTPEPVPGLAALNTGVEDGISVISCPSAGNCTAGGLYTETEGNSDSFVVSEVHGKWGQAFELQTNIPGFNGPDGDSITVLSCPSAGDCVVGGVDNVEHDALAASVFVASEVHGTWGKAIPVPNSNKLNQGDQGALNQLSCSGAGNCGVAGSISVAYDFGFVYTQPFVATEVNGTWGKAVLVPGLKPLPLSDGEFAETDTISCPAPARCSAGGSYENSSDATHAFVASQP